MSLFFANISATVGQLNTNHDGFEFKCLFAFDSKDERDSTILPKNKELVLKNIRRFLDIGQDVVEKDNIEITFQDDNNSMQPIIYFNFDI